MSSESATVSDRIKKLEAAVKEACRKARRERGEVQIVYVSKTVSREKIAEAALCGARDFGENRVQEFQEKAFNLKSEQERYGFRWHFIGHLQTNKVKHVVGETALIHSLDTLELAEALERQAKAKSLKTVDCLIQINSSAETTKFGIHPEDAEKFVNQLKGPAVRIKGLMTIGPLTQDEALIRQSFRRTRLLRDDLKKKFPSHEWDVLSMGMSGDYPVAIEEGSTLIRVGSAVFGERKPHSA